MNIKKNFNKIAFAAITLIASLPAYAIASIAPKVNKDTRIARNITSVKKSYHHKNKNVESNPTNLKATKKTMKNDLALYKSNLAKHKSGLKKAEKKGKTSEATAHRSEIKKLERMVDNIKERIEALV